MLLLEKNSALIWIMRSIFQILRLCTLLFLHTPVSASSMEAAEKYQVLGHPLAFGILGCSTPPQSIRSRRQIGEFRDLKLSRLENFRAIKLSRLGIFSP
jgi:hypothetical protein